MKNLNEFENINEKQTNDTELYAVLKYGNRSYHVEVWAIGTEQECKDFYERWLQFQMEKKEKGQLTAGYSLDIKKVTKGLDFQFGKRKK